MNEFLENLFILTLFQASNPYSDSIIHYKLLTNQTLHVLFLYKDVFRCILTSDASDNDFVGSHQHRLNQGPDSLLEYQLLDRTF